jgi:hypothetical protein
MRIDCPACGKTQTSDPVAACSRCGSDLRPLQQILAATEWRLRAAAQALRDRRWTEALRHAELSWSLKHGELAARVAFLAALALKDAPRIRRWQQVARNQDEAQPAGTRVDANP